MFIEDSNSLVLTQKQSCKTRLEDEYISLSNFFKDTENSASPTSVTEKPGFEHAKIETRLLLLLFLIFHKTQFQPNERP